MTGTVRLGVAGLVAFISLCTAFAPLRAQTQATAPMAGAHMTFSAGRAATGADSTRALAVVDQLRRAIARYPTLDDAEAAGYQSRRDAESVRTGKLLHVGRRGTRRGGQEGFDAGAPQALLYRRQADGQMVLAGAMFVAPLSATEEDLDAMIPLGVARWHRHVNVCVSTDRRSARRFPKASTPETCEAAGGRFRPESRYMIHVMTDAGNDLSRIFPQGQIEMPGMEMVPGHEH